MAKLLELNDRMRRQFYEKYTVLKDGRVYSRPKGRYLSDMPSKSGYVVNDYCLSGGSYKIYRHRVVAETYLKNPRRLEFINHINGNKADNSIENLEWCTHQQNIQHAWDKGLMTPRPCKLNGEEIKMVKSLKDNGFSQLDIARAFGVTQPAISKYLRG